MLHCGVYYQIPDYLVKCLPPYYDGAREMFRDGVLPSRRGDDGSCVFLVFAEHPQNLICVSCDGAHMQTVQHTHVVAAEESDIEMGRYDGKRVRVSNCVGGTDESPPCSGQVVVAMPAEYEQALRQALSYFRSVEDD